MKKSAVLIASLLVAVGLTAPASAHTEADVVAVPAGREATVSLKPTHGCGDSPTTVVAVRAPVEGATAKAVDGWTATAKGDGEGNTVVEWTGGVLPVDQTGTFPVTFTAPDQPGLLLLFPSIQTCEDGSELSWISGDPANEFPAPRVLVLPADQDAATSIDQVAPDAPGRDQLTDVVDIDGPSVDDPATETTLPAETVTTTADMGTTAAPSTTATDADDGVIQAADDDTSEDDSSNTGRNIAIAVALVVLLGGGAALGFMRQRTKD